MGVIGEPLSEEIKLKISQSLKGRTISVEHRKKISETKKKQGIRPWLGKKRPKFTEETRKRMSESHKGEKHHNWKGGIYPKNKAIREGVEYKIWRENVFTRDNFTCVFCGARSGDGNTVVLNADHIKPFAYYPELRFDVDNGRTLCYSCHRTTETFGSRARYSLEKED